MKYVKNILYSAPQARKGSEGAHYVAPQERLSGFQVQSALKAGPTWTNMRCDGVALSS